MSRLSARKLLMAGYNTLWENLTGMYTVVFDDAEIPMSASDIILSSYGWLFHRRIPSLPLTVDDTIMRFTKKGIYAKDSGRKLFNHVLWKVYDHLGGVTNPYDLMEEIMWTNMHLYNHAVRYTARFICSLDVDDYFEMHYHSTLYSLKQEVIAEGAGNIAVNSAISKVTSLMTSGDLKGKDGKLLAISKSCIAGIIKPPQAVQAVFMRGFVPDIDRENIPKAITNCLMEGMNTPLDFAILGREGAIAAAASLNELRSVCYDGRKLSFVAQGKYRILPGDCGSTEYVYWTVRPPKLVNGIEELPSDLVTLVGTNYITEDGKLQVIRKSDTHLYGKTIRRRSSITCRMGSDHECCATCFGELSISIPPGSNAGVTVSKKFSQEKAQNALSIKHILASLLGAEAILTHTARKYFTISDNQFYRNALTKDAGRLLLIFKPEDVLNIAQVQMVKNVHGLVLSRISGFNEVEVYYEKVRTSSSEMVSLSNGDVNCMLSYVLLDYIKNNPDCIVSGPSMVTIDITHFTQENAALFTKPDVLTAFSTTSRELSNLFERSGKQGVDLSNKDITGTIARLTDILLTMDATHISIIELILSAYLSVDGNVNVRKGINGISDLVHVQGDSVIFGRSLSSWMMYHSVVRAFLETPKSYLATHRDDSVLDVYVCPEQVYAYHHDRNMTTL